MINKLYHSPMKERLDTWLTIVFGLFCGGGSSTILHINIEKIEGLAYFFLSTFFAGIVGYLAKKVGELIWSKLTKRYKNERVHKINPTRKR